MTTAFERLQRLKRKGIFGDSSPPQTFDPSQCPGDCITCNIVEECNLEFPEVEK